MTAPSPIPPVAPVVIVPVSGSRLEALAEAYAAAKPVADEAKDRLDTIVAGIKNELSVAAPGAEKVDLNAPGLAAPLRLSAKTSWRLDTAKFKAEEPETYVRFARQSTIWELRAVAPGRGTS